MPSKLQSVRDLKSKSFEIRSKVGSKSADIIIYEQIGESFWGGGVSAKTFNDQLKNLDPNVTQLNIRINSPGGDVFDGVTIYNRLKQHKAKKVVYIDGLAASIASIIALAGDEVVMGEGALYMIHLPWTCACGNRKDLDSTVDRLMDVEEQLISIYAKKTKMDRSEIKAMLEQETWLDADQAIEMGFVDSKSEDEVAIAASAMGSRWINKAPRSFRSEAVVVQNEVKKLKEKISERIARK